MPEKILIEKWLVGNALKNNVSARVTLIVQD